MSALAWQAPVALAIARPRSPLRDAGIYALQMWAYIAHYEMPNDDPERAARAAADRLSDPRRQRCWAGARRPPSAYSASLGRPGEVRPHDLALAWIHWSWFLVPHGTCAYILAAPPLALRARRRDDGGGLRPRDASAYWAVPTAPPWWAGQNGNMPHVRRIMVETGEHFWGRAWGPLYDFLGGNPFAAMPSLHFGTSVMAAHVLSDVGTVPGALGWALCGGARLRARLPGRALRGRPDRRPRARGGRPQARAGGPAGDRGDRAPRFSGSSRAPRDARARAARGRSTRARADGRDRAGRHAPPRRPPAHLHGAGGVPAPDPRHLRAAAEGRRDARCAQPARATPAGAGSPSQWASTRSRSSPTQRSSAACSAGGTLRTTPRAARLQSVVRDHAGGPGGHHALLGGRRGRCGAHLLGAAQGGNGAAPGRLPDGGVHRAALLGLRRGADRLRRADAHRRAERARHRWPARSCPQA